MPRYKVFGKTSKVGKPFRLILKKLENADMTQQVNTLKLKDIQTMLAPQDDNAESERTINETDQDQEQNTDISMKRQADTDQTSDTGKRKKTEFTNEQIDEMLKSSSNESTMDSDEIDVENDEVQVVKSVNKSQDTENHTTRTVKIFRPVHMDSLPTSLPTIMLKLPNFSNLLTSTNPSNTSILHNRLIQTQVATSSPPVLQIGRAHV